jgi:hypothetical protein
MPAPIYRAYTDGLRALATDPRLHDDCELLVVGACNALMGAVAFFPDGIGEFRGGDACFVRRCLFSVSP